MRVSFRAVTRNGASLVTGTVRVEQPVIRVVPDGRAGDRRRVAQREPRETPPNVFIYIVDTLRADYLGVYGYPEAVSPHIDQLAQDGVLFERTITNSPWTKPSVASIFTGMWPATHNVLAKGQSLPDEATTLAEMLRPAGFQTAAFVANGHVTDRFGFDQGFDRFLFLEPPDRDTQLPPQSVDVNAIALRWLARYATKAPLFLYVHTVDPHGPYDPPKEFRDRFAPGADLNLGSRETLKQLRHKRLPVTAELIRDMRALYAAEVAFNDDSFGDFVAALRAHGMYDDALIVFLSDHGEAFHEHESWEHGKDVYGEVVNVPLIIKFPARDGLGGRRVADLTQQVDVVPTILDYLGLPIPAALEGRSLVGLACAKPGTAATRPGFIHLHQVGKHQEAIVDDPWKLIRDASSPQRPRYELYNLVTDPGEHENLIDAHPIVAGYLGAQLQMRRVRAGSVLAPVTGVTDAAVEENLRALGYIE
jgi:choline-sulfatase